jgi:hypothetical protein
MQTLVLPKTQKRVPWKGWSRLKPGSHQKTVMFEKCGKKCFLGAKKSFPICNKNTCKVNSKGVYSAFIRSRQFHRKNISQKAEKMLISMKVKK